MTPEELDAIPEADSPEGVLPDPRVLDHPLIHLAPAPSQHFGAAPKVYAAGGLRGHNGIDYEVPEGTDVSAAAHGIVVHAGPGDVGPYSFLLGNSAGGAVLIRHHAHGLITGYAHLSAYECQVGDDVVQGEVIGQTGATGYVGGPHLHFEVLPVGPGGELAVSNGYLGRVDPAPLMADHG